MYLVNARHVSGGEYGGILQMTCDQITSRRKVCRYAVSGVRLGDLQAFLSAYGGFVVLLVGGVRTAIIRVVSCGRHPVAASLPLNIPSFFVPRRALCLRGRSSQSRQSVSSSSRRGNQSRRQVHTHTRLCTRMPGHASGLC